MSAHAPATMRDWALIVLLGASFGAAFPLNAILLRDIGPLAVSFWRIALGAAAVWALILATGISAGMTRRDIVRAAILGLFSYALPFALYPLAQQHLASGVTGIVNAMTPVMVVGVSHVWPGGERATLAKVVGAGFGFCGILLLMLPAVQAGLQGEAGAFLIALAAPLSYAVAFNWLRRLRHLDPVVVTGYAMALAALLLLPVVLMVEPRALPHGTGSWGALAVLGPVLTGAAFVAVTRLAYRIGPVATSTLTFIAPVSAVILGATLLGERIEARHLAGMAAIFVGLVIIDGRLWRLLRSRMLAHDQPGG